MMLSLPIPIGTEQRVHSPQFAAGFFNP